MTRTRALKLFAAAAVCLSVFAQVSITRSGSQPSRQGSSENFTGAVRVYSLFHAQDGARATTTMTHIAIQEQLDGKVVDWLEKVSDEQYRK